MSKSSITIPRLVAAMLIAIGLGAGSTGIAGAQDASEPTTACGQTTEGGGDRSNSVSCDGGDSSTTNGNTNQANSGSNTNGQSSDQGNANVQGNANDTTQGNTANVSDLGGDDNSSNEDNSTDDDVTNVDGDGNVTGDGGIIGALIAILLDMMGGGEVPV